MDILVGYRLVPKTERLLRNYLEKLTMVVRAGHYYVTLFKGYQGVTQGDLLSSTIINMVWKW